MIDDKAFEGKTICRVYRHDDNTVAFSFSDGTTTKIKGRPLTHEVCTIVEDNLTINDLYGLGIISRDNWLLLKGPTNVQ